MTKHMSVTMQDWVIDEIIGSVVNKSARAEELIIKGYMSEKEKLKNPKQKQPLHNSPVV